MPYFLDTNIVIHARDGTDSVLGKLTEHDGSIFCSALSFAELQRGLLQRAPDAGLRRARVEILLPRIPVVPFDAKAARAYGRILDQRGWVRGRDFDRMIAAHAISFGAILVTNNVADFEDIPGLQLENWAQ